MLPTQLGIYKENCGKDISQCPSDYPKNDISDLCQRGPVNEICINNTERYPCTNGAYRNIFCKTCWQNRKINKLETSVQQNNDSKSKYVKNITPSRCDVIICVYTDGDLAFRLFYLLKVSYS